MKFSAFLVKTTVSSPLGPILLAASPQGLAGLWFAEGQKYVPDTSGWREAPDNPVLQKTARALQAYFAGQPLVLDVPLDLQTGTPFQQAVWQALLRIPQGSTTSYGALSASIGKPSAVRAVGSAVGRNPVSILVPCHRVVGANGSLTGYAGGLERKTALLQLEGVL
jgi:methylated-DNA-[protein]-cysteine S-methyltransferase